MSRLTTHILDTARGKPADAVDIQLYSVDRGERVLVASATTNADGRCDTPLLEGVAFKAGVYELQFSIGAYFKAQGIKPEEPSFLDVVILRVGIAHPDQHYHVPLLVSPYGYSTYRGS